MARSSTKAASRWSICMAATTIFPENRRSAAGQESRRIGSGQAATGQKPSANTMPMVQIEPRKDFPKELQVGMQFEGGPEDGAEDDFVIYRVTNIADDKVVLDGNHPLAGMALVFTCTVTSIRPASEEEVEHGHVHHPDEDGETCH